MGAVGGAAVFASHSGSGGAGSVHLAAPPEQHLAGPGAVLIAPTPADRSQGQRVVVTAAPHGASTAAIGHVGPAALIAPANQTVRLRPIEPVAPATPAPTPSPTPVPVPAPAAPVQAPPAVPGPVVTAAPEPRAPAAADPVPAPTPAPPITVTPVPVETLPDPPPDLHGFSPGPAPTPVSSDEPAEGPRFKTGPAPVDD